MNLKGLLLLSAGGTAGTLARYFTGILASKTSNSFPLGTLSVNLAGCFLIGLFVSLADRNGLDPSMKLCLITGFCGAFTTFSTFMLDSNRLVSAGDCIKAGLYVSVSLILGFLVFRVGEITALRFGQM